MSENGNDYIDEDPKADDSDLNWKTRPQDMAIKFFKDQIDKQDQRFDLYLSRTMTLFGFFGVISSIVATGTANYVRILSNNEQNIPTQVGIGFVVTLIFSISTLLLLGVTYSLTTFRTIELNKDLQRSLEWKTDKIVASKILSSYQAMWNDNEPPLEKISDFLQYSVFLFVLSIISIFGLGVLIALEHWIWGLLFEVGASLIYFILYCLKNQDGDFILCKLKHFLKNRVGRVHAK